MTDRGEDAGAWATSKLQSKLSKKGGRDVKSRNSHATIENLKWKASCKDYFYRNGETRII